MIPVAFAEEQKEPKLSLYDEPSKASKAKPGYAAIEPSAVENAVSELKAKVDKKLDAVEVDVGKRGSYKYDAALQSSVANIRKTLVGYFTKAEQTGASLHNQIITDERSLLKSISGLKSDKEQFLPNAIYVLIAGLTGSIVARPRSIVARMTVPWIFGIGTFVYVMPRTAANTFMAIRTLGREKAPQLAEVEDTLSHKAHDLTDQTKVTLKESEKSVQKSVHEARQAISNWAERK